MDNRNTLTVLKNNDMQYGSYIVFTLDSNKYAVDIQNIIEVINIPEIDIPVSAPKGIIGMFEYNGMVIKAVDICPLIGKTSQKFSITNQLIIAVVDGDCFAMHTENIENIIRINNDELQPLPFKMENAVIKNVYKDKDFLINVIDVKMLNKVIDINKSVKSEIDYSLYMPSDEKTKYTLELRTKQLKQNNDVFSFPFNLNTVNQYIMFTLGNHNYYLDVKYVKELVSVNTDNIAKLPYTKDFVKGLLNIRGEFLVVIDLKCFLNNEHSENSENAKVIVAEGKDFNIALLADKIKYIKNLKQFQTVMPDAACSKYISSEFEEEGTLYSILNFEKLINDENIYINIT